MSWRATSWAAEQLTGSPITKLVLLKLADNANDEGTCWPSIPLIAEHTELNERTVQQHLKRLEAIGLVRIERRMRAGVNLPNIFHLSIAAPMRRKGRGGEGHSPPPVMVHQGGAGDSPGGESDGIAYKDEPPIEPINEPPTTAPAGAGQGGDIHKLGKGQPERFEQFRSVIADTWPGGFPAENEIAAKGEFAKVTRSVDAQRIIDCARLQGEAYQKRQGSRSKAQGQLQVPRPSRWLAEGQWDGWMGEAERRDQAEAKTASALGRVRRALGAEAMQILQDRIELSEAAIAVLDGITFEPGPPPRFLITSQSARIMLENRLFALQRAFGEGLIITMVPAVKTG